MRDSGRSRSARKADLLILRKSLLEDIRNTREIDIVIKRGRLFHPAALTVE